MQTVFRHRIRIYYEDTDHSGVVYHANYLRWFERARSDFVRLLGIDQRAVNEAGEGAFAVADLTIHYLAPARLDDGVRIETTCTDLRAASCRMARASSAPLTLDDTRPGSGISRTPHSPKSAY